MTAASGRDPARALTFLTAAGSGIFAVALFVGYWASQSELALAQAADSLLDSLALGVLAWTVRVARTPADEDHPLGHTPAEPIGALVTAVLAGVLGLEVGRSALVTLWSPSAWNPSAWLLALFGGKTVFKAVVYVLARRHTSPALRAITMDARNDIATSLVAFFGFFAARWGYHRLDAALALPLAAWILYSGVALARENIHLLMGAAPSPERQATLLEVVLSSPGVLHAHRLRAHFLGTSLIVHVHVVVEGNQSVRDAHAVAEEVRRRVEREPDVALCSVHLDASDRAATSS